MELRLNMLLTLAVLIQWRSRGEESDLSDMQICRPLELQLSWFFGGNGGVCRSGWPARFSGEERRQPTKWQRADA
jgi:hypothetical protein